MIREILDIFMVHIVKVIKNSKKIVKSTTTQMIPKIHARPHLISKLFCENFVFHSSRINAEGDVLGQFLFFARKTWFHNHFHRLMCVKDIVMLACFLSLSLTCYWRALLRLLPLFSPICSKRIYTQSISTQLSATICRKDEKDEVGMKETFWNKIFFDTCFFHFYPIYDSRNLLLSRLYTFSNGCLPEHIECYRFLFPEEFIMIKAELCFWWRFLDTKKLTFWIHLNM